MTYRAKVIVITGASGGLGTALASEFAEPGHTLLLQGRDAIRLADARQKAEALGARVETLRLDLRDTEALNEALRDFDARHPIDLLIANAGVKTGNLGGSENPDQLKRVLDVNLTSTIHTVQAILPAMLSRKAGRIAIVSSLAALSPHADLLSYTATKAGLYAYATALRRALNGTGVTVTSVIPGFIDTPMTDRQNGPAPMLMSPEKAARLIAKGLMNGKPCIAFPKLLVALAWLAERLPAPIADRIVERYRARILPDRDEAP